MELDVSRKVYCKKVKNINGKEQLDDQNIESENDKRRGMYD